MTDKFFIPKGTSKDKETEKEKVSIENSKSFDNIQ